MPRIARGSYFAVFIRLAACAGLCASGTIWSQELPAGKILEIRLTSSLATFSSSKGNEVEGVIIAPVQAQGRIVIPMGAKTTGTVRDVNRVGSGLLHESASIDIEFNRLILPDGSAVSLTTQVTGIENARESVDQHGRVKGIRSTGTLGYRANNLIAGFAMFDPIAYLYVNVAAARVLRFSEPEIWFPAGTELSVRLLSPVKLTNTYKSSVPPIKASDDENTALRRLLRNLPYRTATANSNKPSDLTNLVFLGSPGAVKRAFQAAGWVQADRLNTISGFLTLRSIAENQEYRSAPMSTLLLDEQRPYFEFSKTLNTFSKRDHTRLWLRSEKWQGTTVLTASSTQDIGIQLSRKNKTFIHVIDTNIDGERTKIVNDLIFTGCVDEAELFPRPWLPADARNATGEELITDRRVAVLKFNECAHPRDPINLQAAPDRRVTPTTVERGFRQGILITRNDIFRGNLIYQGYEGTKFGIHHLRHAENTSAKPADTAAEDDTIAVETNAPDMQPGPQDNMHEHHAAVPSASTMPDDSTDRNQKETRAPFLELGLEGGWLRFGSTLAITKIDLQSYTPEIPSFNMTLQNRLHNGWAVGTSVTLNSWRYFSNEFAFDYQRGEYKLGASFSGIPGQAPVGYSEETTGLLTNEFGYSFVANVRSREKRFRPYVAAGPAFQLLHITDAPFKSTGGVFKVGLRNVGLILAAYNFANEPPLDGGGVFQFGFQYGGGVKFRVSRRWLLRLDYRETLSPQPNFVERSIKVDDPSDSDEFLIRKESDLPTGPLRQQRLTGGISFVF
jgi:opacity protein-like surface antigen